MVIGERLREERKRLGFTLDEFAKLGGVGRTTQIAYEKGTTQPGGDYLGAIAAVGADAQFIVSGHRSVNTQRLYESPVDALNAVIEVQQEFTPFTADQIKLLIEFAYTYQADKHRLRNFVQAAHRFTSTESSENGK